MMKYLFVMLFGFLNFVFAADPAWFTDTTTQLAAILIMVGTALGAKISIELVPLAWGFVKRVIGRG